MYGRVLMRCGAASRLATSLANSSCRLGRRLYQTSAPRRSSLPPELLWTSPGKEVYNWSYSGKLTRVKYFSLSTVVIALTAGALTVFTDMIEDGALSFRMRIASVFVMASILGTSVLIFFSRTVVHRMFYTPESKRLVIEIRSALNRRQRMQAHLDDIKPKSRALGNVTVLNRPLFMDAEEVTSKEVFEKILQVSI